MNHQKAERLGHFLRDRRLDLGFSARHVAREVGVDDSTINRLEQGRYRAPSPAKLSRISDVLKLGLADVFALAGYATPSILPSLTNYLRLRYPELNEEAIEELQQHFATVIRPFTTEHMIQMEMGSA